MPKDEVADEAVPNDGRLGCPRSDIVKVDYVDPVYGTTATTRSSWTTPGFIKLRFASAADSSDLSLVSSDASRFLATFKPTAPRAPKDTALGRRDDAPGRAGFLSRRGDDGEQRDLRSRHSLPVSIHPPPNPAINSWRRS